MFKDLQPTTTNHCQNPSQRRLETNEGRLSLQLKRPTDDFLKVIHVIPRGRLRESREENITNFPQEKIIL